MRSILNIINKKKKIGGILSLLICACVSYSNAQQKVSISETVLKDKIKGGWVGQTVGVTYGGPTEFKYAGNIIPDSVDIPWYHGY